MSGRVLKSPTKSTKSTKRTGKAETVDSAGLEKDEKGAGTLMGAGAVYKGEGTDSGARFGGGRTDRLATGWFAGGSWETGLRTGRVLR